MDGARKSCKVGARKGFHGKKQWSDDKILPVDDEGMIIATWNDGCKKDMGITLEEYNAQAERHKEKENAKEKKKDNNGPHFKQHIQDLGFLSLTGKYDKKQGAVLLVHLNKATYAGKNPLGEQLCQFMAKDLGKDNETAATYKRIAIEQMTELCKRIAGGEVKPEDAKAEKAKVEAPLELAARHQAEPRNSIQE